MTTSAKMAAIAALVGEAGRARMLIALMDGRALTATELAQLAGICASTASGHLGKLTQAGLLAVLPQGRHRYFRLASVAVARLLEGIMVVAAEPPASEQRPEPRIGRVLRFVRMNTRCGVNPIMLLGVSDRGPQLLDFRPVPDREHRPDTGRLRPRQHRIAVGIEIGGIHVRM